MTDQAHPGAKSASEHDEKYLPVNLVSREFKSHLESVVRHPQRLLCGEGPAMAQQPCSGSATCLVVAALTKGCDASCGRYTCYRYPELPCLSVFMVSPGLVSNVARSRPDPLQTVAPELSRSAMRRYLPPSRVPPGAGRRALRSPNCRSASGRKRAKAPIVKPQGQANGLPTFADPAQLTSCPTRARDERNRNAAEVRLRGPGGGTLAPTYGAYDQNGG